MSTGGPDLFVICKSCGSEVSPYITECPYCGNRLRKRAPKLDRDQRPAERKPRRTAPPILSRLKPGEIPGIRADRRPYATIALVIAGLVGCLLWRTGLGGDTSNLVVIGKPGGQWWRDFTAAFVYDNTGYAFLSLGTIAIFGWLLERRHGPLVPLGLFLLGGVGGIAATAVVDSFPSVLGAGGGALALVCAWAVPDLIELSASGDVEGDLLGAGVIAVAVALMPLADVHASWIADIVGVAAGFLVGLALSRTVARRGAAVGPWAAVGARPRAAYDRVPVPPEPRYTDAELDAAIEQLTDPGRLRDGQDLVMRAAPSLQRVLAAAIADGGWFDSAHGQAVREAAGDPDPDARLSAVRMLLAEETRMGMLVGVAVGFELARMLDGGPGSPDAAPHSDSEQEN